MEVAAPMRCVIVSSATGADDSVGEMGLGGTAIESHCRGWDGRARCRRCTAD
jgi:hypothetical protein